MANAFPSQWDSTAAVRRERYDLPFAEFTLQTRTKPPISPRFEVVQAIGKRDAKAIGGDAGLTGTDFCPVRTREEHHSGLIKISTC